MDTSALAKKLWLTDIELVMKRSNPLFTLFSGKPVEVGKKTAVIPVIGAGEAKDLTRGAAPDLAGMTAAEVDLTLNKSKAYDEQFEDIDAIQYDVDSRGAYIATAVPAHMSAVDTTLIELLEGYRSTNSLAAADYLIATATPVADDAELVGKEVGRLLLKAMGKLKGRLGKDGVSQAFMLLDSLGHDNLVMGSPKQSPERTDLPFGYATGRANPVLGVQPYDAGVLTRTFVDTTEYVAAHTVIRGFVCMPSAVAYGVWQQPKLGLERSEAKRQDRLCSTIRYGLKSVATMQFCEINLKVLGDHT